MQKSINKYFLDSNVLIRFLKKDGSQKQQEKSKKIFKEIKNQKIIVFVNSMVLHESSYILARLYKIEPKIIAESIKKIMKLNNFKILDLKKDEAIKILNNFAKYKIDFADCFYHFMSKKNKLELLSFDKDFEKLK